MMRGFCFIVGGHMTCGCGLALLMGLVKFCFFFLFFFNHAFFSFYIIIFIIESVL